MNLQQLFLSCSCLVTYFVQFNLETWVALAFISPGKRKDTTMGNWTSQFHELDTTIHSLSYFDNTVKPLVIIVHGWRSRAFIYARKEPEHYIKLGLSGDNF